MSSSVQNIQQNDLYVDKRELEGIEDCIERRWLSEGPVTEQFAQAIANFTGASYATFAPNGTLGLFLALLALDLPKGSEIIIPGFTFYASATAAVFAGLRPVFVDVNLDTFNVLADQIEKAITPHTSAIMAVHIYGQSCDIGAICEVARKFKLKVIEDAAQALGVQYQNQHVGCMGDVGVFSFFSDKVITTGEGAAIVTHQEPLFRKLKLLRNQGRPKSSTFIHPELGMNFRITDLQSAIGLRQLAKFPEILKRRLHLWDIYKTLLSKVQAIKMMEVAPFSNLVPFRFLIKSNKKEGLAQVLEQSGIATRSFFYPMNKQPKLQEYHSDGCQNAGRLYEEGLCLPVHHHLKEEDVERICYLISSFEQGA